MQIFKSGENINVGKLTFKYCHIELMLFKRPNLFQRFLYKMLGFEYTRL